jgi:hypothetical protein
MAMVSGFSVACRDWSAEISGFECVASLASPQTQWGTL